MTWTTDDNVMAQLREWLVQQGFVVLSDHYNPDSFGNQEVVLARPIAIRLVRDRSEWGVFVAGSDGKWLPLDRWVKRTTDASAGLVSAIEQDRALRTLLAEIEQRGQGGVGHDISE